MSFIYHPHFQNLLDVTLSLASSETVLHGVQLGSKWYTQLHSSYYHMQQTSIHSVGISHYNDLLIIQERIELVHAELICIRRLLENLAL
jgi:hypothetical protein